MITTPRVSFGLYVAEVKMDASLSTVTPLQPFSNVANLETDNVLLYPNITYEPNYWLLSGTYKFIPEDTSRVRVGMMSLAMSDENGDFDTPPELQVDFTYPHTTDGIGFRFSLNTGDYASQIEVEYYAEEVLISSASYTPNDAEFSADNTVENFDRIVIRFLSTNQPRRYLRLLGIDFGKLITFSGTSIKQAAVVEEMSAISTEMKANALNLTLFSADEQFSILNPGGEYLALKERQPITVYLYVDSMVNFIGQFYLDTWENASENEVQFTASDMVGVMDTIPFRGGIYSNARMEDLIFAMMDAANIPYELDPELYDVPVSGWIRAGSYREALQQIAFAAGASVDCSRGWALKIYKTRIAANETPDAAITRAEKGMSQSITMRPLVTAVTVVGHDYIANSAESELFNGTLSAGTHEILFSEPQHDLTISGATILASGANYAQISVAEEGTVVLSGQGYTDTRRTHTIQTVGLGASVKPNVLEIKEATLVNAANLAAVTQRVHDYYQQRYLQKVKLFAPEAQVGNIVDIETMYEKTLRGLIEKMEVDLTGGFTVNTQIVGVDYVG